MSKTRRITRRTFLTQAAVGGAALAMGPQLAALAEQLAASATNGRKPNILLIISDEHNAGVLGCYGNKIIKTPNLDALAAKGVVFENCYTPSPLCVPARLAFTAGKYVSRVGAWDNSCMLPGETPSLPRVLNAAGYESFLCGKMHYDATCRYGFTEIGGNMNKRFMDGTGGRRAADDFTPAGNNDVTGKRFGDFHVADSSAVIAHDQRVTQGVREFLSQRKAGDKPFFLLAGYLAPHPPLVAPQAYHQAYKDKVPMPTIPPGHIDSLSLNYKHLRSAFGETNLSDETIRFGRELYYGLTQWVDEQIGQVLAALGQSPMADDTIVIYTSDHGENMGEHGMWWKYCMFDTSARVPLIVSFPPRWQGAQRRGGVCSLLDLGQTITELAGAKPLADSNGTSMTGVLDDPKAAWKDMAVSEYYAYNIASGFAMIRQGKYKYVYHTPADASHPCQRELYDLQADAGELTNLAGDAKYKDTVESLHAAMVKEIGEEPDKTELRARADLAKGYGRPKPAGAKGRAKDSDEG